MASKKAAKTAAPKATKKATKTVAAKKATAAKKPTAKKATAKGRGPVAALPKAKKAGKPPGAAAGKAGSVRVGVREGARAPAFELPDQDGAAFSSGSLAGRPYVLYFYPKDDTPGCTREACEFRDELGKFQGLGVRVVGVSPDKPESHTKFRQKYGLSFTLLSDVEKTLAQAYGVWVKKQNYGREYMGIERSTFLVDGAGTILKAWRGVRVDGHVAAVLAAAS